MRKNIFLVFCLVFAFKILNAQSNYVWNGKACAVILTYDDGLNVDLTNVIPALDSLGLKGTFYISDYFGGLISQIPKWRLAAEHGHELGNHTIYHPCAGNLPGRSFAKPDYDLNNYNYVRLTNEIRTMNTLLKAIDGKSKRTFAFPCGDTKIHDTDYIKSMQNEFLAARGVRSEITPIDKVDLYNMNCFTINGQTGTELIQLVKSAMQKKGLLIFLFHGVGGEHSLNVSLQAHSELLHFLALNEQSVWTATLMDVAQYIRAYQKQKNQ